MNDEFRENGVVGEVVTQATLSDKSKLAAALLALFLGCFGAHRFYLGKTGSAIAMLIITLVGVFSSFFFIGIFLIIGVAIWAIIDFILILCGGLTDAEGRKLK